MDQLGFLAWRILTIHLSVRLLILQKVDDLSLPIRVIENAYKNNFSRKFAVLSLSKNPFNPLMWSHYGDSHFGVVLGINVGTANLNDAETSVIPAKFGQMRYVGNKYENEISQYSITDLDSIERINSFIDSNSHLLERAFLYKSDIWSYEEEVRVVKNIANLPFSYYLGKGRFENWTKKDIGGRPIYCFDIPKGLIESIFLGINYLRKPLITKLELIKYLLASNLIIFFCFINAYFSNLDKYPV